MRSDENLNEWKTRTDNCDRNGFVDDHSVYSGTAGAAIDLILHTTGVGSPVFDLLDEIPGPDSTSSEAPSSVEDARAGGAVALPRVDKPPIIETETQREAEPRKRRAEIAARHAARLAEMAAVRQARHESHNQTRTEFQARHDAALSNHPQRLDGSGAKY